MRPLNKTCALATIVAGLAVPLDALASNFVYMAQTKTGSGSGLDASDCVAYTYFNSPSNWVTKAPTGIQIGPDTTVYLCGSFTGAANSTLLTAQGSGKAGAPVTIFFEPNAVLSSPVWSASTGAINLNSESWIVVDGGTNGVIQNTANGTGLKYQNTSVGVYAASTENCEVENLSIVNLYVRTSITDDAVDQTNVNAVKYVPAATHFKLHNNLTHDVGWGYNGYGDGLDAYFNEVYNMDHGFTLGVNSGSYSGMSVHDNYIHDMANWDTQPGLGGGGPYHHDGIHIWGQTGGSAKNISVYNNQFGGDSGLNATAWIFVESSITQLSVYNNVLEVIAGRDMFDGALDVEGEGVNPSGLLVFNNVVLDNNVTTGGTTSYGFHDFKEISFENNIALGSNTDISFDSASSVKVCDYNLYDNTSVPTGNTFGWHGVDTANFSTWQHELGGDTHSQLLSPAEIGLSSSGFPQAGSAAIGAGADLTSLGIPSLDRSRRTTVGTNPSNDSLHRPASGAWTIGAFQLKKQ